MRTLQAACVIGLLAAAVPARAVDGPCKVATKGTSSVAKACAKGGPEHGAKAGPAEESESSSSFSVSAATYGPIPSHTSPLSPISFFQMGARSFSRSIAARQAEKASAR